MKKVIKMKKSYVVPALLCIWLDPCAFVATSMPIDKSQEIENEDEIGVKENHFKNYDVWEHIWTE